MGRNKSRTVFCRICDERYDDLSRLCKAQGNKVSDVVRIALTEFMQRESPTEQGMTQMQSLVTSIDGLVSAIDRLYSVVAEIYSLVGDRSEALTSRAIGASKKAEKECTQHS
jgi:hypothetical protein